jgi:hypothetical protein
MRAMQRLLACALFGLAACGSRGPGSGVYDSIAIDPAVATVTVRLDATAMQTYRVLGTASGHTSDITTSCALSIDPTFGAFTGAMLKVMPHGGKTSVTATCGAATANGELVVNLVGAVIIGTGTPGNAPDQFTNATPGSDPTRSPLIQYPLDRAVSPRNIPPIEVQWAAAGNDLFHISMASGFAAIDVYTTDVQATLAAVDWDSIAGTAAGDDLTFVVEGLAQAAPAMKYASAPISITMSTDTIDKTAIYWWASSQGNIITQTFGNTSPPGVVKGGCTACHSLSRTGTRIGYSRCVGGDCNNLFAGFMHYDPVAGQWTDAVNADAMQIKGSYTTFAPLGNPFPDDSQSLAIVSMATGTLALYDPDAGAAIASNLSTVAQHGPGAPRSALMADWSPDGARVVFASTPHPGQWIDLSDGSIAVMSYAYTGGAHVFGEPQFVIPNPIALPSGSYTSFFFPSFSPDGAVLVFDAARGAWRNFQNAASAGQRLMLADPSGAWVVDLAALNGGNADHDITWPHWAPTVSSEYYWVVFSSERDYGHEVTAANTAPMCVANGVKQCKQLWLGAIARNRLGGGQDPSAPPMWLPGQDVKADNISPYWTVPVGLQ